MTDSERSKRVKEIETEIIVKMQAMLDEDLNETSGTISNLTEALKNITTIRLMTESEEDDGNIVGVSMSPMGPFFRPE